MRAASRLLATLARGEGAYLNARQPTGLTGVLTHPSPRPHLIYLYNETLRRLAGLPAHSVYRQATENLTRHRLQIVQSTVPDGLEEWRTRIAATVDQHGGWVKQLAQAMVDGKGYLPQKTEEADERDVEWNDEYVAERAEGPQEENDRLQAQQAKDFGEGITNEELGKQHVVLEDEPPLTADQVSDIEHKIQAGLLEEIVMVARRELDLVNDMRDHAVWEELEERPAEGQWTYFERSQAGAEHSNVP